MVAAARGRTKCMKKGERAVIDDLEHQVSQAMIDLENNNDIKEQLRPLYFIKAKELTVGSKQAIVIWVPVPLLKQYRLVQQRLTRELEKKFSGRHVILLAWRRILPKPMRGKNRRVEKQKRPRSRTLTSVHEAMLADLVYPAEIVGRRTRVKLDGKRLIKIHLDKAQMTNVEHKTDTFVGIYKKLTGKDVTFEFPEPMF